MDKKDLDKPTTEPITSLPQPSMAPTTMWSEFKTVDPASVVPPAQTAQTFEAGNEDLKPAIPPMAPPAAAPQPIAPPPVVEEQPGGLPQMQSPTAPSVGTQSSTSKEDGNKYQYKPAITYTIQQAGDKKGMSFVIFCNLLITNFQLSSIIATMLNLMSKQ